MFWFWDPTFFLLIPAMIFALWTKAKVKSTYARFSRVGTRQGLSGSELARKILDRAGLGMVRVRMVEGKLTDNYNPRERTLNLSRGVYNSSSIAALGITAHEAGHAIQHGRQYAPLQFRNGIYPVVSIGSNLAFPLFFIGFLFRGPLLMDIGIILFFGAVLFSALTLPIEFNASRRAIEVLKTGGYLGRNELEGAERVLNAAALTYVAATAMAISQLLRFLILRGTRD